MKTYRHALVFVLAGAWALSTSVFAQAGAELEAPVPSEKRWSGPNGRSLPFASDEEVLEFLRRARVVGMRKLLTGKNQPYKVRLERDGVEANAIFRTVDIRKKRVKLEGRIFPDFHDSYAYECAAYELARVLGIDNVPPCVQRVVDLEKGSVQLWVENATMELDRREKLGEPREVLRWMRQKQMMRLFDALVYNFDRNQTNMLIDGDWKLWFVDHTRSFRKFAKIEKLDKIIWCERGVWESLQVLGRETLSRVKKHTSGAHVTAVLKRRDLLVEHLSSLVDSMGEDRVVYDIESPGAEGWAAAAAKVAEEFPETSSDPLPPDDRR